MFNIIWPEPQVLVMQGQAAGKFNLECLSKMMEMEYSWDWRKQFALSPTGTRAEKLNLNRLIMKKKQQSKFVIIQVMFFCFVLFLIKTPTITARLWQYCIVQASFLFVLASSLREMEGLFREWGSTNSQALNSELTYPRDGKLWVELVQSSLCTTTIKSQH